MPQSACMTLRACIGYDFLIETMQQSWKTPSSGMLMSRISGCICCKSGRKMRSVALARKQSSIGGLPTTVAE